MACLRRSRFFTTITSLIPNFIIQNFGRGSGRNLNLASYHYFFNTKTQKSVAVAAEFRISIYWQPLLLQYQKSRIVNRPRRRPDFEFWILLAIIIYLLPKFKITFRPRWWPNFELWILLAINIDSYLHVIHCFYIFSIWCI